MVLLDTNVYIYLANGTIERGAIMLHDIAYASVTKIEALGFTDIKINELLLLNALFAESNNLALTDNVIDKAVTLRQSRRMSLGDAIVAATALEHDCVLWTANDDDFKHIEGLKLFNPLKS